MPRRGRCGGAAQSCGGRADAAVVAARGRVPEHAAERRQVARERGAARERASAAAGLSPAAS
ncbi:MAG: hypothetical protein ACI4OS_08205, partial [Akkermansia sp.]